MIITKKHQESWVNAYVKEKHTTDECTGFIDGIEKALSFVQEKMPNNGISPFIGRCLTFGVKILPYELNKIISASEKYKVPDDILNKFNAEILTKYVKALDWATREDSRDWSQGLDMLKELGFEQQNVVQGHRQFVTMIWQGVAQHSI